MSELTFEQVSELLRYCPESGKLFWRYRDIKHFNDNEGTGRRRFTAAHSHAIWNARYPETEAGTFKKIEGYGNVSIFGKRSMVHRVCWLLHYGEWPKGDIDHIDGNPRNNKIENLRDVTRTVNMRNACLRSDNSTGFIGVSKIKSSGKFNARIHLHGKEKHLGNFSEIADAIAARKRAEVEYGFHENHGRSPA